MNLLGPISLSPCGYPRVIEVLPLDTNGDLVGITGTPIIDPATDTVYFYAKSYPGTDRGVYNGAYGIHALDINNLK